MKGINAAFDASNGVSVKAAEVFAGGRSRCARQQQSGFGGENLSVNVFGVADLNVKSFRLTFKYSF